MKKKIRFNEPQKTVRVDVPSSGSGFISGLVFGAIAGAAGFFLYGTKKGRLVKKNLHQNLKKWQSELNEIKENYENPPQAETLKLKTKKPPAKTKKIPTSKTK